LSTADSMPTESRPRKKAVRWGLIVGIVGVTLTLAMTAFLILFHNEMESLKQYGYIGAFLISILGGATIIIPVPMQAVTFALGSAMSTPLQVVILGLSAAAGELLGAYTIYMTGRGAGQALSSSQSGRIQRLYERMLGIMERRGPLVLFLVASVVNPFFYPTAMAAGALRIGLWKYTFIVLVGKIIKCMTVVFLGYYGLGTILRAVGVGV
jgi:membrane protein YqaA with SNARE-associated domain